MRVHFGQAWDDVHAGQVDGFGLVRGLAGELAVPDDNVDRIEAWALEHGEDAAVGEPQVRRRGSRRCGNRDECRGPVRDPPSHGSFPLPNACCDRTPTWFSGSIALLDSFESPTAWAMAERQAIFTEAELLSDHDYATPHVIDGQRLHGGFDANAEYVPPRSKVRRLAIDNWTAALRERGGDLLDADASLLTGPRVPNPAQQRYLIQHGVTRPFWNGLTVTGKIEGRGRMIGEMPFPDMQRLVVEDIGGMALGHLKKGLLKAHGVDEGGEPDKGIGGHDVMWFVARDLAFGADAHPDVEPPGGIARPEGEERYMPELEMPYEMALRFLMNLLLIEFRAEIGFASSQETFRTPGLFAERQGQALEAAEIVERIRTDEKIHVESLRLYLGELRSLTLKTVDGGTVPGAVIIDRFWTGLVEWATVDQPRLAAERQYGALKEEILGHPDGAAILVGFEALADPGYSLAA